MAVELATAYVSIVPSAKGIAKGLQDELRGPLADAGGKAGAESSKRFGARFKSGLSTAAKAGATALGVAFAGAVAIGKQSIDAASDLDESMTKVGAVFGDAADSVISWSKNSATAFGQSQQSALEAAGTYGNLFQAFGVAAQPAKEMSQTLVELAADLASFNNTSVEDALTALQSGLSGETEPLKRYGVAINDVRLKEEALALGLISSTKEALSPAAKAQAAYALVMKDTALAQGDFGRTSDGLANQQRILSAQWTNAKAAIGKALLPAMTAVVSFIAGKLIPRVQDLAAEWMPRLAAGFRAFGAFLRANVVPVLAAVGEALRTAFQWVISNQPVLIGVLTAIGVGLAAIAVNAALTAISVAAAVAPFIAIGAAIAAAVAGVIYAYQNWEWFRTAVDAVRAWMVDTLWPAIQSVFGWLRDNVPPILRAVGGFFTGTVLPALQAVWAFISEKLWPIFRTFGEFLVDAYVTYVQAVITVITTLWGWLQTLWDRSEGLRSFLASAFKASFDVTKTAISTVSTAISTLWGWLQTIWDRAEPFRAFLAGAFWLAVTIVKTAFEGIGTAVSTVWSWFQTAWDKAKEIGGYFEGGFNTAIGVVSTAFDTVGTAVSGVVTAFQTVVGWLETIISKAQAAIDKIREVLHGEKLDADWITNRAADLPGRAAGGPVSAMKPYVVGEEGWEVFIPKADGYVVDHASSMAMTAGGGPMVAIDQANFYTPTDVDGFARAINMQLAGA